MGREVFNTEGFFGMTYHTDSDGSDLGFSMPGLVDGSTDHFGPNGEYLGSSYEGFFGMTNHVGADGENMGFSMPGLFGGTDHFNDAGSYAGSTYDGFIGSTYVGDDAELGMFGSSFPDD